jgi:hypothetical protein
MRPERKGKVIPILRASDAYCPTARALRSQSQALLFASLRRRFGIKPRAVIFRPLVPAGYSCKWCVRRYQFRSFPLKVTVRVPCAHQHKWCLKQVRDFPNCSAHLEQKRHQFAFYGQLARFKGGFDVNCITF